MNSDLTIEYNNKTYPFQLYEDPNTRQKQWLISDAEVMSPLYTSERPYDAQIPPEKEDIIEQNYFHAGMGESEFEHGKRYFKGDIDARRKGNVLLPPKITASTVTTTGGAVWMYGLRNYGFEENATTGWTDLDEVVDAGVDPGTDQEGSYCAKETLAGAGTEVFYQDLPAYTDLRGITLTVYAYLWAEFATSSLKAGLGDNVSTTWSPTSSAQSWVEKIASHTVDAAATRIRISGSATTIGATSGYFDNFRIAVSKTALDLAPVVKIIEYEGYPYAAAGNYLLKYDGTDWDVICAFCCKPTDMAVWGDYLFIAFGTTMPVHYYDGSAMYCSSVANSSMEFLGNVGGTFWGNSSAYEIRSSTNPINGGAWSAVTTVRDTNADITSILNHPDTVMVGLTDDLFEITTTDEISRIPTLYQDSGTNTCHRMWMWKGDLYVPTENGSLYLYDIGDYTITIVTPSYDIPGQVDFTGRVMAGYGDQEYNYVFIDYATKVEILAGRWETIGDNDGDEDTDFWWHHVGEVTLTGTSDNIECALISALPTAGYKFIFLGCNHTTDKIYHISNPLQYGDVMQSTNYEVETAGDLVTPWIRGQYEYVLKTFYSLTVRVEDADATHTIVVSYKLAEDTSFTTLGTINADPEETLYFLDGITSKKIQLKFTFASGDNTTTPILTGYTLRCRARPFDLEEGRIAVTKDGGFLMWGGLETKQYHPEYMYVEKIFNTIRFLTEGLTTAKYITFQYKLDDAAAWLTHNVRVEKSPYQEIVFPDYTTGKILQVRFTLASPSDTDLLAYIVEGTLMFDKKKEIQLGILVADSLPTRTGGEPYRCNVDQMAGVLREIDASKKPVTLETFDKQKYEILFNSMSEQLILDGNKREYLFTVNAREK